MRADPCTHISSAKASHKAYLTSKRWDNAVPNCAWKEKREVYSWLSLVTAGSSQWLSEQDTGAFVSQAVPLGWTALSFLILLANSCFFKCNLYWQAFLDPYLPTRHKYIMWVNHTILIWSLHQFYGIGYCYYSHVTNGETKEPRNLITCSSSHKQ